MNIIQRPVTLLNSWYGYEDRVAIVEHIQDGFMEGSFARFNNPENEVSAHFGVSLVGRIEQWVSMERSAWANGILEPGWDSSIPWLAECVSRKIAINRRTISIEHEGKPGIPMPQAQYLAALELHKYIIKLWPGIKVSRKNIIGHYQITPKSRGNCPGDMFPWFALMNDLRREFPTMHDFSNVPGGFPVRVEFTNYWYNKGGLEIFGYPIGLEQPALGKFGNAVAIQYFERARFELQPDNSVMLGLVGKEAEIYQEGK